MADRSPGPALPCVEAHLPAADANEISADGVILWGHGLDFVRIVKSTTINPGS
jgi:hypothetical protein